MKFIRQNCGQFFIRKYSPRSHCLLFSGEDSEEAEKLICVIKSLYTLFYAT